MFLTLFLLSTGLFSAAGGILNWEWFFAHPKARLLVRLFGRTGARAFYVLLGGLFLFFGVTRLVTPPLTLTEPMLRTLTHPAGFALTSPEATERLKALPGRDDFQVSDNGQWQSFSLMLGPDHPLSPLLRDTDGFNVDTDPGFVWKRKLDGKPMRGAIYYFDHDLHPCDNWLFSRHPLASASFVVVVLDEDSSLRLTGRAGLKAIWLHHSSPHYKGYTAL